MKKETPEIPIEIFTSIANIEYFLQDYLSVEYPKEIEIRKKIQDFCNIYGNTLLNKAVAITALNWWDTKWDTNLSEAGKKVYLRETYFTHARVRHVLNIMNRIKENQPIWFDFYDYDTEESTGFYF